MTIFTTDEVLAIAIAANETAGANAPPAFAVMRKAGMIEERYDNERFAGWKLTERGAVWFAHILRLPAPERRWMMLDMTDRIEKRRKK